MYIIMGLHGAPGAHTPKNAFIGQNAPEAGFYVGYQYERSLKFLDWMTGLIRTAHKSRNVGVLEVVNEPVQENDNATSMRQNYYPKAFEVGLQAKSAISVDTDPDPGASAPTRSASASTRTTTCISRWCPDKLWGSGDPNQCLDNLYYAAYDDRRYLKWDTSIEVSPIATSATLATTTATAVPQPSCVNGVWLFLTMFSGIRIGNQA